MTDLVLLDAPSVDDDVDPRDRLGLIVPEALLDVVGNGPLGIDVSRAITAATLDRTLDGAATLTLTVYDVGGDLLRSKLLTRTLDLEFVGQWWRLVKLTKSASSLTLTFEDRDVAHLRQHHAFRKVSRNSATRAQFIHSLVREVKTSPIRFVCPEERQRQKIGRPISDNKSTKRSGLKRREESQPGIGTKVTAEVTIKGRPPTRTQRANMERVIDTAATVGARTRPAQALVMAVIQESTVQNLSGGDSSSVGILQLLNTWFGGSTAEKGGRRDIEKCCNYFLRHGFFGFGGAMAFSRDHPKETPASIAAHTQGNRNGARDYEPWAKEAAQWLVAYGYKNARVAGGVTQTTTHTYNKRYEFRRGEPGQPEDSWTCIRRLADEVRWRAFMDKSRLYFMSEDHLIRAKPSLLLSESELGVDWIDADIDVGKPVSQLTVSCRAPLWVARIGSVVEVQDMGEVLDGRWLVQEIAHDLFDEALTITLKSRQHKLLEPASERVTSESSTKVGDVAAATAEGTAKHVIDTVVIPLARKHKMASGISPSGVAAANARHGATVSGGRSDHQGPPAIAWAADMSNGSSPTPQMDALAKELSETFDIPWTGSGLSNKVKGKYRFQLIYRTNIGGNHYNHVHLGVRVQG